MITSPSRFLRSYWRRVCARCSSAKDAPAAPLEQFGALSINELRREVLVGNAPVDLTPKEYELLVYFKNNRAIALSRESILTRFGVTTISATCARWTPM